MSVRLATEGPPRRTLNAVISVRPPAQTALTVDDLGVYFFANGNNTGFNGSITNGNKLLLEANVSHIDPYDQIPSETFEKYTPDMVQLNLKSMTGAERKVVKEYVHERQKHDAARMLAILFKRFPSLIRNETFFNNMIMMMADGRFFEIMMEIYRQVPPTTQWTLFDDFPIIQYWENAQPSARFANISDMHHGSCGFKLMWEAIRRSLVRNDM